MTLKYVEAPKRIGRSLVSSTRMKKSIKEMIGGYVRADPSGVPTVMHAHKGLRFNADVDAYVETLQIIVVKPPWMDSVAIGERPTSSNKIRLGPIKLSKLRLG
ncbi:hypothetical protein ACTXT7_002207 [Hymenolepis weldensis]